MKRKGIIFGLALATLFSAGVGAVLNSNVPTESITAGADDTKTEMKVSYVKYVSELAYRGAGIYIEFDTSLNLGDWDTKIDATKISYTDSTGTDKSFNLYKCGNGIALRQITCEEGDILTIEAEFTVDGASTYEVKETVSYVCKNQDQNWVQLSNEEETTLTFADANTTWYFADASYSVPSIRFQFNTKKTFTQYQSVETPELIEYKNAYGETLDGLSFIHLSGNSFFLLRWSEASNPVSAMVGDVITFKKGFALAGNEKLAEDVSFVVTNKEGGALAPYTDDCAPQGLSITTGDDKKELTVGANLQLEYAIASGYGTAYFTSSDSSVAMVTKDGLVTGVKEGEVTITAHLGTETVDFAMTIEPKIPVVGVELVEQYTYWVAKSETFSLPAFSAHVVFENGNKGADFALTSDNCQFDEVDTSTTGDKTVELTVTYEEETYTVNLPITVYEIGDVKIKTVAIVEWFNFALFIEYPDSTANNTNITSDIGKLDSIFDKITYRRADGTDIPVTSGYMLSGGNIAIFPHGSQLTIDNYNESYLEGDVIRLEKGLKIWMWTGEKENTGADNNAIAEGTGMYICEGILQETVEYRYDGNVWSEYLEYTDINTQKTDISVVAGSTADSGVSRVPVNATTGTFTYVSSDETVATVSSRGIIRGLKEGTCTITVTLDGGLEGAKTVTLNVTVTDEIVGLNVTPTSLTIKAGQTPDMSQLSATYKWASGKAGEAVDLTNATIIGLDNQTLGEQAVVLSVTVDGTTYTGTLTVVVEEAKSGCSSIVAANVLAPVMLLGAGLTVFRKKRK